MGLETILPDLTNSTTEAEFQKKWESLTFTDNFIFSHVMHDEDICRQVVELILGVRIGEIFSWGS